MRTQYEILAPNMSRTLRQDALVTEFYQTDPRWNFFPWQHWIQNSFNRLEQIELGRRVSRSLYQENEQHRWNFTYFF